MVKKKTSSAKARKAANLAANRSETAPGQDGPAPPGHVTKRLNKKLHFLERVADSKQKALAARAGIRKKARRSKSKQQKPLPDLNSLAELLAEVDQKQQQQTNRQGNEAGAQQPNPRKGRTEQISSAKARRVVAQTETARLQQVLTHPDFVADPLAAIKNHLATTLPEPAKQPQGIKQKTKQQQHSNHKRSYAQSSAMQT